MELMKTLLTSMTSYEKLCTLVLDEVQISKALQYDPGLRQFVGNVSKEFVMTNSAEAACHVLCFMAKGITLHWKQIIGRLT